MKTYPKTFYDIPKTIIDLCEWIEADAINPKLANYYFVVQSFDEGWKEVFLDENKSSKCETK